MTELVHTLWGTLRSDPPRALGWLWCRRNPALTDAERDLSWVRLGGWRSLWVRERWCVVRRKGPVVLLHVHADYLVHILHILRAWTGRAGD